MKYVDLFHFSQEIKNNCESIFYSIVNFKHSIEKLEKDLLEYEQRLKKTVEKNEFLDVEKAYELIKKSKILLHICKDSAGHDFVPYVLTAVAYLINIEDASPDFNCIDGFDDDEEVFHKVIEHFNLQTKIQNYSEKG